MTLIDFINSNTVFIALIVAMITGCFAFIKWLDERKQKLNNERYESYVRHIGLLSGYRENNSQVCITEQIASVWFLLEYSEYHRLTLKILDNPDLEKISNQQWQDYVLPQLKIVIEEIKSKK